MQELIVSCPNCSARYNVAKYDAGTKFKCKSCGKFLIVPEKPEAGEAGPPMLEPEPAKGAGKSPAGRGRKGRGGRRGGTRTRVGAGARGSRRRDDADDYDDDEDRPPLRMKRGPNWPLILGAVGGLLLVIIVGAIAFTSMMNREEEAAETTGKTYRDEIPDEGFKAPPPKDKYKSVDKKDRPKPGQHVGDGKIAELDDDKEEKGEETIRTKYKEAGARERARLWKLRRGLIALDAGVESKGGEILKRFQKAFEDDDPAAEGEILDELDGLEKDQVPLMLNFMTSIVKQREEKAHMMGAALFNRVLAKTREFWNYEHEFDFGMFSSPEEKWKCLTEFKDLCVKKGYKLKEK